MSAHQFFHSVYPIHSYMNPSKKKDRVNRMEPYDGWERTKNELLSSPSDAVIVYELERYYIQHGKFLKPLHVDTDKKGVMHVANGTHRSVVMFMHLESDFDVQYVEERGSAEEVSELRVMRATISDSAHRDELSFDADFWVRSFPLNVDSSAWCDVDLTTSQVSGNDYIMNVSVDIPDIVGVPANTSSEDIDILLSEGMLSYMKQILPDDLFQRTNVDVAYFKRNVDESEDDFYDRVYDLAFS